MSHFQTETGVGSGAYISSVEVENLQLREALVYAERGWQDALDLARKEQEKARGDQNTLEISSLQLELDTVHKKMLGSRRKADDFREKLKGLSATLDSSMEELIDSLGFRKELPTEEETVFNQPNNIGDDDETTQYLFKLESAVKKGETIMALARQAHIAKVAKEELAKNKRRAKKAEGADHQTHKTSTAKGVHAKKTHK